MSEIEMSHVARADALCHAYEWDMSYVRTPYVTRTYEWDMSHVWTHYVTRTNESLVWDKHDNVIWKSQIWLMNDM